MTPWRAIVVLLPVLPVLPGCGTTEFRTGLAVLEETGFAELRGRRVAVVTNPTGVNSRLRSVVDLLAEQPEVRLVAIFAPEHGVRGAAEAGEEVSDARDPRSGVPIYSLYGERRRPSPAMLDGVEVILFDVQDVGVRTYTYLSTLVEVLRAAAERQVEVWVLDRPVPIGADRVEGPVLEAGRESFVGAHTVPLRHGLTAGEFARLVNRERRIGVRLRVVEMVGYHRDWPFSRTGLSWIAPSPNLPTPGSVLVYAGMVLVEGTNLSEGRGTTRPFQLVGAPWIDGRRLADDLNGRGLSGVIFREAYFTPSFSKHRGERCSGVEVHVVEPGAFRPVVAGVALLQAVRKLHPEAMRFHADAFDRLAGGSGLRTAIEAGVPLAAIVDSWSPALEAYRQRRQRVLLYD
ncbi:MAG: DUF1343 domain-containing protein [Planctomycetota bacterium]|nr:DUF1343 domain-containing protein [Planctomycetota bacterium]